MASGPTDQEISLALGNMRLTMADMPGEIIADIASKADAPEILCNLLWVNKRFRHCVQAAAWRDNVIFAKLCNRNRNTVCHILDLPQTLCENKARFLRALNITYYQSKRPYKAVFDMSQTFNKSHNIEYLALNIPMTRLRINAENLRLRTLCLHPSSLCRSYHSTEESSVSYDTAKTLLFMTSLPYLELVGIRNLHHLTQSLGFHASQERPLTIKHLSINQCETMEGQALCTFIRACKRPETVNLTRKSTSLSPCRNKCQNINVALSEALACQRDTMHNIVISRGQTAVDHKHDYFGANSTNMDFSTLYNLSSLSLPLKDLVDTRLMERLPPSLQWLQLQIDADSHVTHLFNTRRANSLKVFDGLLHGKLEALPSLQQIIRWYHAELTVYNAELLHTLGAGQKNDSSQARTNT